MIEKTQVPKRRVKQVGFYQQLILYGVEHSVYFYELVSGDFKAVKKLVVLK